ncbi:hypothetical protein Bca52824_042179 [Brassica carinata]|uniref:DUF287 domain-containing protein n=1 Tax=Brassica carinata TaxID=52824 RepID=A0A8X7RYN6_BRACI|nr:hypothetical protein Bca52824_042179 [Brassica carinata]
MKRKERNREQIGSNNDDSNPPRLPLDLLPLTMTPRTFFFAESDYWMACKLSSSDEDGGSLFLTRVIRGRKRNAYFIEPFILQAWTFPGFVTPLEILAFECIPVLRESFRDPDPNCLPDCPRMCKWKYKRTGTTGFALEEIYKVLGNTKLQDDSDKADIAVDGWNRILIEPEGKIFWEDLFEMDVRTRPTTQQQSEPHDIFEGQEEERVCEEPEAGGEADRESVKELELRLNKRMDDGFALRDETIRLLAARVKELEQDKIQRENWSLQFGEYETCEASGGKGIDNMGNDNEDDAEGEEEADKDGKNSESDAITAAVHTPLPTETTPEDAEGEEEAAKEAYEVAGNEDEVGQKEGETEADKEGETEEGKTDVEDSPSTLQVMAESAEKLEKKVDDKAAAEKAADELAAAEKAASDKEKLGDEEETRPKRTHKPSRPPVSVIIKLIAIWNSF